MRWRGHEGERLFKLTLTIGNCYHAGGRDVKEIIPCFSKTGNMLKHNRNPRIRPDGNVYGFDLFDIPRRR
jgi:hypothetical protein